MKIYLFLSIFSFCVLAQNTNTTLPSSDDMLMENLRNVKNQEVDKYLLENPATKECEQKIILQKEDYAVEEKRDNVRVCFKEKLDQLPDESIEKLSEDLNLKGYGVIKDNSVPVIKNYFDERLGEALYGKVPEASKNKNALTNITQQRFVDHETFLNLYDAQLGKDSLVKISEFCLKYEFSIVTPDPDNCEDKIKNQTEDGIAKCYTPKSDDKLVRTEIEKMIKNDQKDLLKSRWLSCAAGMNLICKEYSKKAAEGETVGNLDTEKFKYSKSEEKLKDYYDSDPDKNKEKVEMARHACKIVKQMKDYRQVVVEINKQKEELGEIKSKGGVSLGGTFKEVYGSSSANTKTIDELTTVSSDVVADQYDDTQVNKDAEECAASSNPESDACKKFFKVKDDNDQQKLILDYELKSMAQVKKFNDEIKDLDQKGLEEYLEKNGNMKMIEDLKTQGEDAIKEKMYQQFKAERMAIVNDLYNRIKAREITQKEKDSGSFNDQLNKVKEDVTNTKEKIRGLYHYSNIVTSYLDITDANGNKKVNETGFLAEQENYKGDDAQSYFQDLKPKDINSTQTASKKGNESTVVDLGFIDSFLQNKIEDNNTN